MVFVQEVFAIVHQAFQEKTVPKPHALRISISILPITVVEQVVHQVLTKTFFHEHVFLAIARAKIVSINQQYAVHVILR